MATNEDLEQWEEEPEVLANEVPHQFVGVSESFPYTFSCRSLGAPGRSDSKLLPKFYSIVLRESLAIPPAAFS